MKSRHVLAASALALIGIRACNEGATNDRVRLGERSTVSLVVEIAAVEPPTTTAVGADTVSDVEWSDPLSPLRRQHLQQSPRIWAGTFDVDVESRHQTHPSAILGPLAPDSLKRPAGERVVSAKGLDDIGLAGAVGAEQNRQPTERHQGAPYAWDGRRPRRAQRA